MLIKIRRTKLYKHNKITVKNRESLTEFKKV
jgi:hypothetical protein